MTDSRHVTSGLRNALVYPRSILSSDIHTLLADGRTSLRHPLGQSRALGSREWIVCSPLIEKTTSLKPTIEVQLCIDRWNTPSTPEMTGGGGLTVQIGEGALRGEIHAFVLHDSRLSRLDRILISGPGMEVVSVTPQFRPPQSETEHLSRAVSALGEQVFHRLRSLRFGFVGVGRLNTAILFRLAASGYLRECSLIDPDVVEAHNTGQSLIFDEGCIGVPKAQACENWLALHYPEISVATCGESLTTWNAVDVLKNCDIVISAPDHPSARLCAAAVAVGYGRVLIDVGTMLPLQGGAGADVRLIGPGRCILCSGGVRGEREALAVLRSPQAESDLASKRDWRTERRGSLDSLNDLAGCFAKRLLERWVTGDLANPIWCQIEEGTEEPVRVTFPTVSASHSRLRCLCPLAGQGDLAVPQLADVLANRLER